VQGSDGRAARRREAKDLISLLRPAEMFAPDLMPRIEQTHDLTRDRVEGRDPAPLVVVAQRTGEPEVLFLGLSAKGLWNQMIDLHWRPNDNSAVRQ